MTTIKDVKAALAPMMVSMEADGYRLDVLEVGATLNLKITALGNACPDCLVPAQLMARMVSAELNNAYTPEGISIEYPNDSKRHSH